MLVCVCRAIRDLQAAGLNHDLETTLWLLPIIYIILTLLRFGLSSLFRPLFILIKVGGWVAEGGEGASQSQTVLQHCIMHAFGSDPVFDAVCHLCRLYRHT